jgi:ubiquinone/menaquinone biosynthesis C-methylase UbiE
MQDKQDKELIAKWSESAPFWEKYRAVVHEMFAPVTQALVEDAGVAVGSTVLDVATGPGEPALSLAEPLGTHGKVVGTDIVPQMVEAARREASRRKLQNASFEVARSESLPFPDNTFDAAVSRFGAMFFPSPVDCVREILRVLKPGGRLALAVWHSAEKNPFDSVVSQVVARYVESPPPEPGALEMFRFAKSGDLMLVLLAAGITLASERVLRFSIRASVSKEDFWTMRRELSERLRTKLAPLSKPQLAQLTRDVIEAFGPYSSETGMSFPAEVLIVSGAKKRS